MLSRDPADLTQKYYQDFRRRYGFADGEMRGHGHGIVVPPIGPHDDEQYDATKFVRGGDVGRSLIGTSRDNAIERAKRVRQRAEKAAELLEDLGRLVEQLRNRVESRRFTAMREVYADAVDLVEGRDPRAKGSRVAVLEGLVRVLRRYA